MPDVGFSLLDTDDTLCLPVTNLAAVVRFFAKSVEDGRDPFVSLAFARGMPLSLVRQICALLGPLESHKGIRIEPPLAGQLYHKAYSADERHRKREGRISQPWELHLQAAGAGITATLISIEETWAAGASTPTLTPTPYVLDSGKALRQQLDLALKDEWLSCLALLPEGEARQALQAELDACPVDALWGKAGDAFFKGAQALSYTRDDYISLPEKVYGLRVILVYVDGQVTHGDLMSFVEPVRNTHSTIHVYLNDDVSPQP